MNAAEKIVKGLTSPIRSALLVAGCAVLLLAAVESKAQPPAAGNTSSVRGKVDRFTTAPLGETDGAVLDDGTWLHWPPHMQARFTAAPLPPPPARGDSGDSSTVRGKVERFTTAPRGEVDGAVLDDGTQLHWPPHMEAQFKGILKEGDRVRATGRTETGPAGDRHFEVQVVTNLRTDAKAENPDFANGPPPLPPGREVARGRPADREQRLRDLEDQVDQLRREIQRLRRDR